MTPNLKDVQDLWANVKYFLYLGPRRRSTAGRTGEVRLPRGVLGRRDDRRLRPDPVVPGILHAVPAGLGAERRLQSSTVEALLATGLHLPVATSSTRTAAGELPRRHALVLERADLPERLQRHSYPLKITRIHREALRPQVRVEEWNRKMKPVASRASSLWMM